MYDLSNRFRRHKQLLWVAGAAILLVTQVHVLRADHGHEGRDFQSVSNPKWKAECSSCHMLYHPGLLPARSWRKMMGELDKHFGENASLDTNGNTRTREEITRFLVENAADRSESRRARRFNQSIPEGETPLRVSETAYFERKHDELSSAVWKRAKIKSRANCIACHGGAEKGNFSEHEVVIPR